MERQPVSSSSIASIGYDKESQMLEVEFVRGAVYQYYEVPAEEYDSFVSAGSIGQYFNFQIKHAYACVQV